MKKKKQKCQYQTAHCSETSKSICSGCGGKFCDRHIGIKPDESNRSITKNAPLFCHKCYKAKYGEYF